MNIFILKLNELKPLIHQKIRQVVVLMDTICPRAFVDFQEILHLGLCYHRLHHRY